MGGDVHRPALTIAETAHGLVESDTRRAAALAERAVALARAERDVEAEVAALHALGFAQHELGDARAIRTLRAAVRVGERHGLNLRAALARRPLSIYLAYAGATDRAVREIDAACAVLTGLELARSEVSRIAVLHLAGQAPKPEASERALKILRQAGDTIWEARLLKNRGFMLAERGDAAAAEQDLTQARDLYAKRGATAAALGAEYELARIALTRGDLPACLARLDAIDPTDLSLRHRSNLELLRAKALVAARLIGEARDAMELAQAIWEQGGIDDPEGRLDVVILTLLSGEPARAYELARRAQRSFAARRRRSYAARAAGLALASSIAAGTLTSSAIRSGRRATARLGADGWREEALRVRLSVARAAIELGSVLVAQRELAACSSLRRGGPVVDRIEARHVEALVRLAAGDRSGAQRAAHSGLRLLERYRAALGASDLRSTASQIGVDLARLGLRIALASANTASVLTWAEMLRASALRLAPAVTPSENSEVRNQQSELRRVLAQIRRAESNGRPARSLVARRLTLESSIRRASRHTVGGSTSSTETPTVDQLAHALGPGALVELIEIDGELIALVSVQDRLTLHKLGPLAPVADELEWLVFALRRMARTQSRPQRATTLAGAQASAEALGNMLLAPLADTLGERSLVIVPTASLQALPWSILPSLRGRPLVVAPSVVTWLARRAAPRRRQPRPVLVAGPRLRHAGREITAIRGLYPDAEALTGSAATATAVLRALDGATVAHLACHGHFRADSPLFSSLELADGPLNAYELQRLERAPELIVLSACDLATSTAEAGDELLGLAAALIAMGTRTIIASVTPVPDALAQRVMVTLHRQLAAGESAARALAHVQATLRPSQAALSGFVCLGVG